MVGITRSKVFFFHFGVSPGAFLLAVADPQPASQIPCRAIPVAGCSGSGDVIQCPELFWFLWKLVPWVPQNPSNSTVSSSLFIKVAIHKMGIPHLQTLLECFFGTEECWREKHQDIGRKNFQPRPSCHFNQSLKYLHKIDNISSQYIVYIYNIYIYIV